MRQSSGIVLNEIIGQIHLLKASPMNEKIVQSISFYLIIYSTIPDPDRSVKYSFSNAQHFLLGQLNGSEQNHIAAWNKRLT